MATETEEKTEETSENGRNVGRIEEIQGVVIEVVFPDDNSYVGTLTSLTTMQRNGGPSAASYAVLT